MLRLRLVHTSQNSWQPEASYVVAEDMQQAGASATAEHVATGYDHSVTGLLTPTRASRDQRSKHF